MNDWDTSRRCGKPSAGFSLQGILVPAEENVVEIVGRSGILG